MDLDEIKQLINSDGERVILVENGRPVLVLLSFEDYKRRFNFQKEAEKEKIEPKKLESELTLEDLPF